MFLGQVIYVIVTLVQVLLTVLQLMMFARAVLSWITLDEESRVSDFLYAATEPVIAPVRELLDRIPALSGLPIDMSFIVTYLLIGIVQMLLPTVTL